MYVGRTNSLFKRLQTHGWGNPYSAALSMAIIKVRLFRLWHPNLEEVPAAELWALPALYNMRNNEVIQDQHFQQYFDEAREQILDMQLKIVQIENQHEQAMFEVYAHVVLGTPYNNFRTH